MQIERTEITKKDIKTQHWVEAEKFIKVEIMWRFDSLKYSAMQAKPIITSVNCATEKTYIIAFKVQTNNRFIGKDFVKK